MAREVSVKITANTAGFTSGMTAAGNKAKQTAKGIADAFDSGLNFVGKNKRKIDNLGSAFGSIGLVAAVGVGAAVKSAADFDKAMSGVAATGSDARASLGALRDAALKAGADTKFSATEAAGGVEALAKAGVSAKDTLGGGLSGALNLAAAGNLGVADSAETAASALNQFGLKGKDVPHVADLLAQAAGTAQGEVSDMAAALNQGGLVAAQFGLSIDETAQSFALFAKSGLQGSDAGTSFKTMLTSLYAPTGNSAKELDKLGVSAYDASGAIKPFGQVIDELKSKVDTLSEGDRNQALKNLFGSDAIRPGTILLKQGSAGLSEMAAEFGKFGSAADVAATKMDNLKGDLEQLRGSFETALIGVGEGGTGPLRDLVQGATGAVNAFNDLGDSTKSSVLGITAGIATVGLSAAGIGKVAIFASEAKGALKGLGVSAKVAGLATGGIGLGITLAAGAFGAYAAKAAESKAQTDDLTQALLESKGAIDGNIASMRAKSLEDSGALKAAQSLGISITDVTQASLGNADAQARVNASLGKYSDGVTNAQHVARGYTSGAQAAGKATLAQATAADTVRDAIAGGNVVLQNGIDAYNRQAQATQAAGAAAGSSAGKYDQASAALDAIGSSSTGAAGDLTALTSALFDTSNAALAVSDAQIGFEAAVDAAAAAAKKNGDNLKVNTAAGRENKTALNQLAQAGQKYVEQLAATGTSSEKVKNATKDARGEFIKQATAMTGSAKKAKELADSAGLIPKDVVTTYEAKTGNAKADLAKVNDAIKGLPKDKQVEVRSAYKAGGIEAAKAKLAEIKDKTVTATAKGNTQGATKVDQAMKQLDNRVVTATAKGNPSGATQVKKAVDSVKSKKVTVSADASGTGAVYGLRDAIATVKGKTVHVKVERDGGRGGATGGLVTAGGFALRGPLQRSQGGPVWGAGTATSDSIPALLSNGEFVIRAAAVNAVGLEHLTRLNAKGFASGGSVSRATGGAVSLTSDPEILKVLVAQFHVDQAENLKERRAADKELAKAVKTLNDTQQAAVDAIKTLSSSLQEPYRSKSTDVDDVLAALKDGASDLTALGTQVKQLKGLGLDQTVIDQITADGAVNGGELAGQIIAGGKGLVDALNQANQNLTKASTSLGITASGVKGGKGFATGGYTGSIGANEVAGVVHGREYVVNSEATSRNRSVLDAINYGRAQINEHRFMPAYAGSVSSSSHVDRSVNDSSQITIQYQGNIDEALRKAKAQKRDNMTMARLSIGLH